MRNRNLMILAFSAALCAASSVAVGAGSSFRLEVGSSIAGVPAFKVKNAVVMVRALVCVDPATARVTGTAEGIINGRRHTVPLRLVPSPTPGVYAVQQQWPAEGQWVLHLAGACPSPKAEASTLVPLQKTGFIRAKTQVLLEPATPAQVEAALADLIRKQS